MAAHEQGRPVHRLAGRSQPIRQPTNRVAHLPGPRTSNSRTDGRLDAVRGTDPVGKRDIPGTIGSGAVVRRPRLTGHGGYVGGVPRPSLTRAVHAPAAHAARHHGGAYGVGLGLTLRNGNRSTRTSTEGAAQLPAHEDAV